MPRTVYYAAVSADGFIAAKDGGVGWLDPFNAPEMGYEEFYANVGAVVLGRTTYEQALTFGPWPYAGCEGLIVTSRAIDGLPEGVSAVSPERFADALRSLRDRTKKDVWIVGGGKTARAALAAGLLDELELYVIPRLLGEGIPLFSTADAFVTLGLLETRAFANGIVKVRYAVLAADTAAADPAI
jgi:dihydrofolate reductase